MLPPRSATPGLEQGLRQACAELARRLRAGEACASEAPLAAHPELATDIEAALELIYTEFVVREERGEGPSPEAWYARFPQWREQLGELFQLHAGLHADTTISAALRKGLLASAVPFYEAFVKQKPGDAKSEEKRGLAYYRLARLRAELGEHKQALADYQQMQAIFQKLVGQFPTNPAYRRELAGSHNNLGMVLVDLAHPEQPEVQHRRALQLRQELAAEFPGVADYRWRLAASHSNLGRVLDFRLRLKEAEAEYRRAIELDQGLAAQFPKMADYRSSLGTYHSNLGSLLGRMGRSEEAAVELRQALQLRGLGVALRQLRRPEKAEAEYRQALRLQQELAAEFPSVPHYRKGLAANLTFLGNLLLHDLRRPEEAEAEYPRGPPAPARTGRGVPQCGRLSPGRGREPLRP